MRRLWSGDIKAGAVLALALSALASPAFAAGQLVSTTDYADHPVPGTSAAAIYRDMNAHPIPDPDGGPSLANITHDHTLALSTAASGAICRVDRLTFTWHFVVTLPRAVDEARLAARDRADWRAFVRSLCTHELHHRAIFLDCGKSFVPAAAKLTAPTCSALDANVRHFLDAQYAACITRQQTFDRADTPHQLSAPFISLAKAERLEH